MTQYDTTVRYFDHAANLMGLSKNMQALLLIPERELKVQVTLERDNGEIATFIGYRVQHDSARGPMKGGLRYHQETDADEVRARHPHDLEDGRRQHPVRRSQRGHLDQSAGAQPGRAGAGDA